MSSTSTNFHLVLATSGDTINVVTHLAGPLTTLDALLAVAHTGTGQLKNNLVLNQTTLVSPVVSGTLSAATITASTGTFNTITATGGALTVNSFTIGTYGLPAVIGSSSYLLTVSAGNATWQASTPNTGANQALSNLSTIAFNTSLNTCTAGFVTVNRLITTSGAFTGLTVFQATTGTFSSNLSVTGTLTANVVNCTGGTITAGGLTIGTYALPSTIGATGQVISVTAGTLSFAGAVLKPTTAYFNAVFATGVGSTGGSASVLLIFDSKNFDPAGVYSTTSGVFTCSASGYYHFGASAVIQSSSGASTGRYVQVSLGSAANQSFINANTGQVRLAVAYMTIMASGATISVTASGDNNINVTTGVFWGYKVPDS